MTPMTREEMARRVAAAIPAGAFVNLGIGIPTLVAQHVPADQGIILHSENGILGFGGPPPRHLEDQDLTDAGKRPVTMPEGGCYMDTALSFAIMRGGHLDVAVLGAFEVSCQGDLANWWTGAPDEPQGVGGAMDLASGAKQIWVMVEHQTRDRRPKIVEQCSYPLTAAGVVTRVFTDLAVFAITPAGLTLQDMVPGLDLPTLQALTGAPIHTD